MIPVISRFLSFRLGAFSLTDVTLAQVLYGLAGASILGIFGLLYNQQQYENGIQGLRTLVVRMTVGTPRNDYIDFSNVKAFTASRYLSGNLDVFGSEINTSKIKIYTSKGAAADGDFDDSGMLVLEFDITDGNLAHESVCNSLADKFGVYSGGRAVDGFFSSKYDSVHVYFLGKAGSGLTVLDAAEAKTGCEGTDAKHFLVIDSNSGKGFVEHGETSPVTFGPSHRVKALPTNADGVVFVVGTPDP